MSESTRIKGNAAGNAANVFVDEWDDGGAWLSIQTRSGGAHCTIPAEQIPVMIAALQALVKKPA